jgi:hypothetical protein
VRKFAYTVIVLGGFAIGWLLADALRLAGGV